MGFLILVSSTVTDTFYYPFWMTLMSEYILVRGTLINKYLFNETGRSCHRVLKINLPLIVVRNFSETVNIHEKQFLFVKVPLECHNLLLLPLQKISY